MQLGLPAYETRFSTYLHIYTMYKVKYYSLLKALYSTKALYAALSTHM